ncbi:MAG: hypothetical protein ACQEWD_14305 [Bacteroidota bacterium]
MTPHQELLLNRKEVEEAFETLKTLNKDGFYNVPKLTWWVLRHEELYRYCHKNRHYDSCIDGMGCPCCWDKPESRFSYLYSSLQEIIELYDYEGYFKQEMAVFENVRDDYPALMQWLKKNEKLGTEDFILFWIEWYEEDGDVVKPFIMEEKDLDIKFKTKEWKYTLEFLEAFNEIYWTSDACPD